MTKKKFQELRYKNIFPDRYWFSSIYKKNFIYKEKSEKVAKWKSVREASK